MRGSTYAIGIMMMFFVALAPIQALAADNGAEANFVNGFNSQVAGAVSDLNGQFCRGVEVTGRQIEGNAILESPLVAMSLAILNGARYVAAIPVQYLTRTHAIFGGPDVDLFETSPLAQQAADNPAYVGIVYGGIGGPFVFGVGYVGGAFAGIGAGVAGAYAADYVTP